MKHEINVSSVYDEISDDLIGDIKKTVAMLYAILEDLEFTLPAKGKSKNRLSIFMERVNKIDHLTFNVGYYGEKLVRSIINKYYEETDQQEILEKMRAGKIPEDILKVAKQKSKEGYQAYLIRGKKKANE